MKYTGCINISYMIFYMILLVFDYREGTDTGTHAIKTEIQMKRNS